MAQNHDYIPWNDAELLTFTKTLYAYARANYSRWGAPDPQQRLEVFITAFETALAVFSSPNHGKVDTLAKNEAKDALIAGLRVYVQGFIARNPAVTDEDKEQMALPLRDTTPTRHSAPEAKPETEASPSGKGQHTVTALNPHSQKKDKPEFVTGVAFAHRLRDPDAPKSAAGDMPSEYQTATSRVFQWKEEDYGKIADYAAAYESGGGKRGPWSDVVSLIVA
ncbi:MAG: hypothetical protein LBG74_08695 [Spirochaetaceae bacterium]|nr:hypothetical protein [Spirochaetaceae bacterium]